MCVLKNCSKFFGYIKSKFSKGSVDGSVCPADIAKEKDFMEIYEKCKPYTMTSIERMFSLYKSVEYVVKNNIPGDFIECGVWRGGSSMLMAYTLLKMKERTRKIYLYDTYAGMTEPSDLDVKFDGQAVRKEWKNNATKDFNKWCFASIEDVKSNLFSTGYPQESLFFIQGDILKTIPETIPQAISVLRLDTDWFETTYHELSHLFPRLSKQGVLIIDDYGFWEGARQAVDQYFQEQQINILLDRVDVTGRIGIK